MTKANLKKLLAIYDALSGLASKTDDLFNGMYAGGSDQLFSDFEDILKAEGVVFKKPEYAIAEYIHGITGEHKWGICSDPENPSKSWVLCGYNSAKEALETLNTKSIFEDYAGKNPKIIPLPKQH